MRSIIISFFLCLNWIAGLSQTKAKSTREAKVDSVQMSVHMNPADSLYTVTQVVYFQKYDPDTIRSEPKTKGCIVAMYQSMIRALTKKRENTDKQITYFNECLRKL